MASDQNVQFHAGEAMDCSPRCSCFACAVHARKEINRKAMLSEMLGKVGTAKESVHLICDCI